MDISPEAIHQRLNKKAMAFLQDMIRQTLAQLLALDPVCDDGLFPSFTKVYLADRTGLALPEALHKTFPGAGGSAAKAGAKIQAVWLTLSRLPCPLFGIDIAGVTCAKCEPEAMGDP